MHDVALDSCGLHLLGSTVDGVIVKPPLPHPKPAPLELPAPPPELDPAPLELLVPPELPLLDIPESLGPWDV
jgi:hypothetical protein